MRTHFLVLTHERPDGLRRLLASIRAQREPVQVDITVLDNGSAAAAATAAESVCGEHGARYVASAENTFMRGKRVLEDLVFDGGDPRPDVVVHVDDDVALSDGWLAAVTGELRRDRYAACGSVERWDGELVYSGQRELRIVEEAVAGRPVRLWDWEFQAIDEDAGTVPVEFAGHRALAVRAEVAAAVRHDETYLIGGEDLDYSLELRHRGGRPIAVSSAALIHHKMGGEPSAPGFRTAAHVVPSWRHFHGKWGFVRRNAHREAGLSLAAFLDAVTGDAEG